MPEIKFQYGKMDLEQDATSKDETVSAILFNAYRVAKSFRRVGGLTLHADTETGTAVYIYYSTLHDVCLAAAGNNINGWADLYTVTANGTVTLIDNGLAGLTPNTPVVFAEDATRILLVANSYIHVYTVATGVLHALIGDDFMQAPKDVTHISILRGFLLANGQDQSGGGIAGDFGWSNDPDYAVWNYENNAARPDKLQSILTTSNDDIFMVGSESTEINYMTGDAAAPFLPNKPATLHFGTPAPYTVAHDGQNLYMLVVVGGSRQILRLMGGREPQLIGFPVSVAIDAVDNITTMEGYIQGERGKAFYILTHPTAQITIEDVPQTGFTLAFDIRAEEWHVWGDWDSQNTEYNAYRGRSFAYAEPWGNKRLIGGNDGKIYLLDDSHTFAGDTIRMALRSGHVRYNTNKHKTANYYEYDVKTGTANDDVVAPSFIHRYRSDGKSDWVTRQIKLGAAGNTSLLPKSRQCGRYRKRQHELVFTDAVEIVFNNMYEDVEVER